MELEKPTVFSLIVGFITGDPHKTIPLLNSIARLECSPHIGELRVMALCNGCSYDAVVRAIEQSCLSNNLCTIISEEKQTRDTQRGLFGSFLSKRQPQQVGIAQARSMLQKYIGLECIKQPNYFAWILDDDMSFDNRIEDSLGYLTLLKEQGVDVVIGTFEGASPNPPMNGLQVQLYDLLHNLRWLDSLDSESLLPDRRAENKRLRELYPDYYYDLSRKHSGHLKEVFWLEATTPEEKVGDARKRLIESVKQLTSGKSLTRGLIQAKVDNFLDEVKDSVNRGGNTFVLNPQSLLRTPNLIFRINGREARRSDMLWAIVNKHYRCFNIKAAPIPVYHHGREQVELGFNMNKVQDEIMGSALYAGLQSFLMDKVDHQLDFRSSEIETIWLTTQQARDTRIKLLKKSFERIIELSQELMNYSELHSLCSYLQRNFTPEVIKQIEQSVQIMSKEHIEDFLKQLREQSDRFYKSL